MHGSADTNELMGVGSDKERNGNRYGCVQHKGLWQRDGSDRFECRFVQKDAHGVAVIRAIQREGKPNVGSPTAESSYVRARRNDVAQIDTIDQRAVFSIDVLNSGRGCEEQAVLCNWPDCLKSA